MSGRGAKQTVIFCDFDGTITENDNIVAIFKHFQPEGWLEIVEQIIGQQISIKEGVGRLFALLPTAEKEKIIRYSIDNVTIRQGFQELLDFCKDRHIEFLVTSGGIDFFVFPILAEFAVEPQQIYCNSCDFNGDRFRIVWPHPCDVHCEVDCGMCKTTIMRKYPPDQYNRILIGDSLTDFAAAKLADTIFARSHLAEKCRELNIPYYAYEDFHDIVREMYGMVAEPGFLK